MLLQIPSDVFLLIASKKFYYSLKQPGHLKLRTTPVTQTHLFCLCFGNFQEGYGGRVFCTLCTHITSGPKSRFSALIYAFSEAESAAVLCHQWPHAPNDWSNVFVPNNFPKYAGKSKVIERKAPLQLPCRTSFPCPHHFYKQLLMRKVGIWCGE